MTTFLLAKNPDGDIVRDWSERALILPAATQDAAVLVSADAMRTLSRHLDAKIQLDRAGVVSQLRLALSAISHKDLALVELHQTSLTLSMQSQRADLLVVPSAGQVMLAGGETNAIGHGQAMVLPAGIRHHLKIEDADVLIVRFDPAHFSRVALEVALERGEDGAEWSERSHAGVQMLAPIGGGVNLAEILRAHLQLALRCGPELVSSLRLDEGLYRIAVHAIRGARVGDRRMPEGSHAAVADICRVILDNLDQELTMGDLARMSGLSPRAVQMRFQKAFGCSPMQWVTQQKLLAARRALERAGPDDKVTAIAVRWFSNLGAFAGRYRDAFGELPSQTLARSQARCRKALIFT